MLSKDIVSSTPVEIWRQCWELTARAELKALSLTCHFFRDICLPLLFANKPYNRKPYNSKDGLLFSVRMIRSSMNIKRLAASSKLCVFPRRWQIKFYSFDPATVFDDSDTYELVDIARELYLESILQGLSAFTGLRAIEFDGYVEEHILRALSNLPALESLTCQRAMFSSHSITPLLQIREFTVCDSRCAADALLNIVSSNFLEKLTLKNLNLPSFLPNLSMQGPYPYLSDLSIVTITVDIPSLLKFLPLCPQLRSLCAAGNYYGGVDSIDLPPLPPSVIPHLQSFYGPGYLAKAIIPGRPVKMVSINQWQKTDTPQEILKSISQNTLPVRGLRLPFMPTDPVLIDFVRECFPYLQSLRLAFFRDDVDRHSPYIYAELMEWLCIGKIALPSDIQAVEIACRRKEFTPSRYRSYLTKLSILYPSLTIAVLGYIPCVKHNDGDWMTVERGDNRVSQFLGKWRSLKEF